MKLIQNNYLVLHTGEYSGTTRFRYFECIGEALLFMNTVDFPRLKHKGQDVMYSDSFHCVGCNTTHKYV